VIVESAWHIKLGSTAALPAALATAPMLFSLSSRGTKGAEVAAAAMKRGKRSPRGNCSFMMMIWTELKFEDEC
jgi:hypothetical protein